MNMKSGNLMILLFNKCRCRCFKFNLQHMNSKLFFWLFMNNFKHTTHRNNNKNNSAFICCKLFANFLQICVNLQKYWNNAMSNNDFRKLLLNQGCLSKQIIFIHRNNLIIWHFQDFPQIFEEKLRDKNNKTLPKNNHQ